MAFTRYYLPGLQQGEFAFSSEEMQHIAGAKRQKAGDEFEVFDGMGHYCRVRITELKSRRVTVEQTGDIEFEPRPQPELEIAVAIPKSKRLQYMIEKLTELGVARVVPVVYERSVAGGGDPVAKYTRWAVEACKQSRNLWLPEFSSPVKYLDYLGAGWGNMIMADFSGQSMRELIADNSFSFNGCRCLIGPEGGFSGQEYELAADCGVRRVRLARNILRIETAAVCFASTLLTLS